MVVTIYVSIATSLLLALVTAFPDGAPEIACGRMVPAGHLPTTTSGESPFTLTISATSYKPGDVITGSLSSDSGEKFRGFLIEVGTAGDVAEEERAVGEFVDLADLSKHVCGRKGITHKDREDKTEIKFSWKAPEATEGDLYIRATVVQQYFPSKYWLGNFSQKIEAQ